MGVLRCYMNLMALEDLPVRRDFDAAGVEQSDHQIRRTMDELMLTAAEQIEQQR